MEEVEIIIDEKDEFIGAEIVTPKGSILKILGHNGLKKNKKKYYFTCNECDKNPIYNKLFESHKFYLTTGFNYSCGCSDNYKLSEVEQTRRIESICKERDQTFLGFDGKYEGNSTYLRLMCNKHLLCWNTTITHSYVGTNVCGCNLCVLDRIQENKIKDNDRIIKTFVGTGVFLEGTKFYRSDRKDKQGRMNYWYYICPVCSYDDFVKEGVCSGKFESHIGNLQSGKLRCRCSRNHKQTKEQKEFKIKKIIENNGHNLLSVDFTNKNRIKDKVSWKCSDCGHINNVLYNSILWSNACNCANCGSHGGYTRTKPGTLYLVRWYGFGEEYLKFGITNKATESRIYKQMCYSKLDNEILYEFNYEDGTHPEILENIIKNSVEHTVCKKEWLPDGYTETTHFYNLDKILKIVENYNNSISV